MSTDLQKTNAKSEAKAVTYNQAQKAIADAGFVSIELKEITAAAIFGKYVEQDIIHTVAPSILIRTMQTLKKAIEDNEALLKLSSTELEMELREKIIQRQVQLIAQQINLAEKIQSAAVLVGKTAPQAKTLNPSFGAREQVVPQSPVQVNIGIQSNGDVSVDGAAA